MEEVKMTRGRIVSEAKALLNEEGLDGLSLRKLAARLGVSAPALYWHFPDKGALLSVLLEELFYEVLDSIPQHANWQLWMRDFGRAVWRAENGARDFTQLLVTSKLTGRHVKRVTDRIRQQLRQLDLPEDNGMLLQSSIQAIVTGWSAFACAPFGKELQRVIDIEAQVVRDIDTLIAGECARRGEKLLPASKARAASA